MRYAIAIIALFWGVLGHSALAHAQEQSVTVTEFFQSDATVKDRLRQPRSDIQIQAMDARRALDEMVHVGDIAALQAIKGNFDPEFREAFPGLVALTDLVETAYDDDTLDRQALQNALRDFDHQGDWYAGVYANIALSVLHLRQMELLLAGQYTQSALDMIPEDVSPLVSDAQLIIAEQMIMLYGISANPERMLEASKTTRRLHAELGSQFDRHELMTNFLLAFNRKRDHQGALKIADLIQQEDSATDTHSELAQVYTADLYNEIGEFEAALDIAMKAEAAKDPFIRRRATGEQMIALSGLGNREDAIRKMRTLDFWANQAPTEKAYHSEAGLHALSLLAASEGDAARAVALMNQRLDLMIGQLRAANANDTSSLLSHLENSRERQQEREAALQREAELQAVQLAQQERLNRLLVVILALIFSAFVTAMLFYRYREINNKRVAALREKALSAEKMKTEFLGVVNHELRTPLNGVIGISDALIHHSPDPQTRAQAETILECGEKLQDLVESMIDMSTIEGGKLTLLPEPVALDAIIEAEAARWEKPSAEKGLIYTRFIAEDLSRAVEVDVARLRQCLKILLSNATRFTHEGRIHLHVTGRETEANSLAITAIVADTGQGMSETVQDRLFTPFLQADSTMTRKYGGAGLSLAIARKLARMMGGDLNVVSTHGRGSEFTLTVDLPLASEDQAETPRLSEPSDIASPKSDQARATQEFGADATAETVFTDATPPVSEPTDETILDLMHPFIEDDEEYNQDPEPILTRDADENEFVDLLDHVPELFAPEPTNSPAQDPNDLSGVRILVVEDIASNQDVIRLMLEREGCVCIPALSAEEGLNYLMTRSADIVLMDIRMPGMDGVEATQHIRKLSSSAAHLPIIVLTAEASADMNAEAMMAGADLFLTKPVIGRDLIEAIRFVRSDALRSAQSA